MKSNSFSSRFAIIIIILSVTSYLQAQTYSWTQLNDFGGSSRFGSFSFVINNFGYLGGGYSNGVTKSDMWQYNPANDSWTQMSNCPIQIRAAGNFAINGKGYLVCGLVGGSTILNDVLEYDPATNVWTTKADFPGVRVYGAASFSINGKGYFGVGNGGAFNGPYYNAFYEYNPVNDTWTLKAPFPGGARYGTFGININGNCYVGLGIDEAIGAFYTDWYQYDPITNTWTQKAFFPGVGRNYTSGFEINNNGYIVCGGTGQTLINDFYKYDPVGDSWTTMPNFTGLGRIAAQAFSIGDTGYFGTGLNGSTYLRDFWKYAPSSTSINEISYYNSSFYPNPCNNSLTISSNNFNELVSIEVISREGKIVLNENVQFKNSTSYKLNLAEISAGLYFVKLNYANQSEVKKILKI